MINKSQSLNNSLKKSRVDSSGRQIVKGQKTHKISFKVDEELVKTTFIENWKQYNTEVETKGCHCVIQ